MPLVFESRSFRSTKRRLQHVIQFELGELDRTEAQALAAWIAEYASEYADELSPAPAAPVPAEACCDADYSDDQLLPFFPDLGGES